MPRQPTDLSRMEKWNMYVIPVEKAQFMVELMKSGKHRAQSAAVRAFMHLYASDKDVRDKVNAMVDDYIVIKADGKPSQM